METEKAAEEMAATQSENVKDAGAGGKKAAPKKKGKKAQLFKPTQVDEHHALPWLHRLTTHKGYEMFSGTLIVLNSIFLGFQTQYLAEMYIDNASRNEPLGDPPDVFFAFHCIFCVLFAIELGLRWVADGLLEFFKHEEMWWNILDIVVVVSSALEVLMELIATATGREKSDALQNVSVIRVLRVVRIVRVARVIRVMKFFRELRMMIYSILGCVKNLMWVIIVLLMTFYMFGVGFTTAACDYLDSSEKWNDEQYEVLVDSFGTIDKSIISLFMSMSGGNDWEVYYSSLLWLPIYYRMAFLLFIAFSTFAVVNIVTGVFVESALGANIKDRDIVVHEELEEKKAYMASMQEIFEEMDEEGNGTISLAEFEHKLKDERVIAYFNALKLDVSEASKVFHLLDHDRSDEVGIDEFLTGCWNLQGESRSLDIKIMEMEVDDVEHKVDGLQDEIKKMSVNFFEMREMLISLGSVLHSQDSKVVSADSPMWEKSPNLVPASPLEMPKKPPTDVPGAVPAPPTETEFDDFEREDV